MVYFNQQTYNWGAPSIVLPNGWVFMENPNEKWMMYMGVPHFGNRQMSIGSWRVKRFPVGIPNSWIWVCLKIGKTPKPNGFADHYPVFKWLFHWEY